MRLCTGPIPIMHCGHVNTRGAGAHRTQPGKFAAHNNVTSYKLLLAIIISPSRYFCSRVHFPSCCFSYLLFILSSVCDFHCFFGSACVSCLYDVF